MIQIHEKWRSQVETAIHISVWLFSLAMFVLVYHQYIPYGESFWRSVGSLFWLVMLFYFSGWSVNRLWERKKYWQFGGLAVLNLLAFTGIQILMHRHAFNDTIAQSGVEVPWIRPYFIVSLFYLIFGILFQFIYNHFEAERRDLNLQNEQKEAELQALRAHINPHFLFNTLNNIYSLAMVDPPQTAEMVLKLSNILRYVIYENPSNSVSLQKEVAQIQEFIDLFQMRMETPANIEFQASGIEPIHRIEPMLLLPFVENAFKHGDFDTNPQAFLYVALKVENGSLKFQAKNSRNEQNRQKDAQGGVGLDNIRKRLDLIYPEKYTLDIEEEEDHFFVALRLELTHAYAENPLG